jgi:hypothetical protein
MADGRRPPPPELGNIVTTDAAGHNWYETPQPGGTVEGSYAVPRLEGQGRPNDMVIVKTGDKTVSAVVNPDGQWWVEMGEYDFGKHDVSVQMSDPESGNVSEPTTFTVDNNVPNNSDTSRWQRAGRDLRVKAQGTQSTGPQPTPTTSGLAPGGGGVGAAVAPGGSTGAAAATATGPAFEKGNAPAIRAG